MYHTGFVVMHFASNPAKVIKDYNTVKIETQQTGLMYFYKPYQIHKKNKTLSMTITTIFYSRF